MRLFIKGRAVAQGLVEYALILVILAIVIIGLMSATTKTAYSTTEETIYRDGMKCLVVTTWRYNQIVSKSIDCVEVE